MEIGDEILMIEIKKEAITGITLLSVEEAEKVPKNILSTGYWWWLRSPSDFSDYAAFVLSNGLVYCSGHGVNDDYYVVRPALLIQNLKSLNLHIGDKIQIFGRDWLVISEDKVLLNRDLGHHRFDKKSNNYETSEIKTYIEDWLKEQRKKETIVENYSL